MTRILICLMAVACLQCRQDAPADRPLQMAQSLNLYMPDDLQATLFAESPMFHNPTNIDIDIRGRVWVTEAVNYRSFNNDTARFLHYSKGDRVVILEDTNADGKADVSKVFVQDKDLIAPTGIAVFGNKVVVSCSPNLIVYTDENGDDKADKKEILLTGFGGRDHDHALHAVFAGPDGNWYFNAGNAGPHVVTDKSGWTLRAGSIYRGEAAPGEAAYNANPRSDDGRIWVGGVALRVNPDGTRLTVLGHNFRNAYEVFPDSYGNLWQNDNDDQVVTCRTTWVMEGRNAGYFSADGTRYWQADQRPEQDIFTAHWHQEDPGVMPAGDRTGAGSPTGVSYNESDALGEAYFGMLMSADAGRNVIFGYKPKRKQSGYDLGARTNLISSLSSDNVGYVWDDSAVNRQQEKWFRPSDLTFGTDGALYIADWFDPVVGGHQMEDTTGYGRIYRITPKKRRLQSPHIDLNTTAGQVLALRSPAVNVRAQGASLLRAQGDKAVDAVTGLLSETNPFIRARAVWLLASLGPRGTAAVEAVLNDPDPVFRATAYRALRQTASDILPYARQLSKDTSAFVRREVAASLRHLPLSATKPVLLELIRQYDGEDRWYLETLGFVLHGYESSIYPDILQQFGGSGNVTNWDRRLTTLVWRLHPPESVPVLSARAASDSLSVQERRQAITALAFINDTRAAQAMADLAKNKHKDVSETATYWLSFRQSNDWHALLDWSTIQLNAPYERKLAAMKAKQAILLDENQSTKERTWRASEMAEDSVGGQLLIGLAAENKVPQAMLPVIASTIFRNPDATVRAQAGRYFKRPGADRILTLQDISDLTGDKSRGKTLFHIKCASCHKMGGSGNGIGPDLTHIGKKFGKPELIDAIINPSAAIVFGYEPWLVNTKDGNSVYGFLVSENKKTLVIRDIAGTKHVISMDNISSRQQQKESLMPDAFSNGLKEQDVADIAAFLR